MLHTSTTKRLALAVAITAALGASFAGGSASADPKQLTAFVGTGSDTTQDVMNALSGHANGGNFTPAQSSVASGQRQLISFNATNIGTGVSDNCITPKVGGPTFLRPNGSTNGVRALSRSMDSTGWGAAECGGITDISGLVDFARSSSGPQNAAATDLTYIPFGRDAVSFAYYRAGGAGGPVTSLTRPQLTSLFTTGSLVVSNGVENVTIIPCGIQTGSGTFTFWNTVHAASATENAATTVCNNLGGTGRVQEHDAIGLKAKGDLANAATPGVQVIIGFSAANYIAKANGVAIGNPIAVNVGIGSISNNGAGVDLGNPIDNTTSVPNLAPAASFYSSSIFGRDVYNVLPTAFVTGGGNNDLKTLFIGSTSGVCSSTSIIQQFGYLSLGASCGSTTLTGNVRTGQTNA